MAEPFCKIQWRSGNRDEVWFFNGMGEPDRERLHALCIELGDALQDAETLDALDAAIEGHARSRGLKATISHGPSHTDPLGHHVSVGLSGSKKV